MSPYTGHRQLRSMWEKVINMEWNSQPRALILILQRICGIKSNMNYRNMFKASPHVSCWKLVFATYGLKYPLIIFGTFINQFQASETSNYYRLFYGIFHITCHINPRRPYQPKDRRPEGQYGSRVDVILKMPYYNLFIIYFNASFLIFVRVDRIQ